MAIHAHSTTVPAVHPALLRPAGLDGSALFRFPLKQHPNAVPPLIDQPALAVPDGGSDGLGGRVPTLTEPGEQTGLAPPGEAAIHSPETEQNLDLARALHARRQLAEALHHGFALLDALDLSPLALDVIDDAIARLDAMDAPGEDLEDDGTAEPWLGQPEPTVTLSGRLYLYHGQHYVCRGSDQSRWGEGSSNDAEEEHDGREDADEDGDTADLEPSLGALEKRESQIGWAGGCDDDRERDESDREPYLSVVEFDGDGDNWHRHGQPTSGDGFDIEDVNERGAGVMLAFQAAAAREPTHV